MIPQTEAAGSADLVRDARPILPAVARIHQPLAPYAWPLIRFTTGLFLMPHGSQKLFGAFGGGGISGTAQAFTKMGFEPGWLWGTAAGSVEFFGGLLVAIGLLTRPAAIATAILLATALTMHLHNGFFWPKGGFEYPLMWLILCVAIVLRGGGPLSLDRAIGREF